MADKGTFASLGLLSTLCSNLSKMRITRPTPIQQKTIPGLLVSDKHHLIVAETGKGKTLAWLLPLLQKMRIEDISRRQAKPNTGSPRSFAIVPSLFQAQELARSIQAIANDLKLTATAVDFHDTSSTISQKLSEFDLFISPPDTISKVKLTNTTDIVIDDFEKIDQKALNFDSVLNPRFIISTSKFGDSKSFLLHYFPEIREFPASCLSEDLYKLPPIKHTFIPTSNVTYLSQLLSFLQQQKPKINHGKCIIICKFLQNVNEIEQFLVRNEYSRVAIHSDISVKSKARRLWKFSKGLCKVLITTETEVRALKPSKARFVVNFGVPESRKEYVYRAELGTEECVTVGPSDGERKWKELTESQQTTPQLARSILA